MSRRLASAGAKTKIDHAMRRVKAAIEQARHQRGRRGTMSVTNASTHVVTDINVNGKHYHHSS